MKKETVIAVVLGIGLGVIVAITLVIRNRQIQIQNIKAISTGLRISPSAVTGSNKKDQATVFEITNPADDAIVSTNSVNIKGKVAKGSVVVISSQVKVQVIKDAPEILNVDFPLALGENRITITAYPKEKNSVTREKQLHIYYLDEQ